MILDQRFPDRKEIGLAVCCDWHHGSKTSNLKAIQTWVDMIRDNQWYVLLMGDLTENATLGSVGSVFEQTITPQEQVDEVAEILMPVKDYILGSISGNHGMRTVKLTGLDPDMILAAKLGCPYFGYCVRGRIQVGSAHWVVVGHHGSGGGILKGSKLNMVEKLARIYPMADLYLMAHAHADLHASDSVMHISLNKGKAIQTEQLRRFSGCGSLLAYGGSYAEAKLFPPAAMAQVVHFLGDRKTIKGEDHREQRLEYRREPVWL